MKKKIISAIALAIALAGIVWMVFQYEKLNKTSSEKNSSQNQPIQEQNQAAVSQDEGDIKVFSGVLLKIREGKIVVVGDHGDMRGQEKTFIVIPRSVEVYPKRGAEKTTGLYDLKSGHRITVHYREKSLRAEMIVMEKD